MMPPLHQLPPADLLRLLDRILLAAPSAPDAPPAVYAGLGRKMSADLLPLLPPATRRAAVLVPLVERSAGLHVLLTQRASHLNNHAGQISFPGGGIEDGDDDPKQAALREAAEEIGLSPQRVTVLGYLPDHLVISGFRVTPVVARVAPPFELAIDRSEVDEVFEVPINFLLDPSNHKSRLRRVKDREFEVTDFPYGERNIWGATAGMLLTMFSLLAEAQTQ